MSVEDRVQATAKNIEGKAQEALGELTGDPEQKVEGETKQREAEIEHAAENLKDEMETKKSRVQEKF